MGAVVKELGIPWEPDEYQALIDFKPCHSYHQTDGSPYKVDTKAPFYARTISAATPLLNDLWERTTHVFRVGINPKTARRLGVQQGDTIVLETNWGRRIEATADLRERFSRRLWRASGYWVGESRATCGSAGKASISTT